MQINRFVQRDATLKPGTATNRKRKGHSSFFTPVKSWVACLGDSVRLSRVLKRKKKVPNFVCQRNKKNRVKGNGHVVGSTY